MTITQAESMPRMMPTSTLHVRGPRGGPASLRGARAEQLAGNAQTVMQTLNATRDELNNVAD